MEHVWATPKANSRLNIDVKSAKDTFEFIPIGDVHYESEHCDLKAFRKLVKYIKETPRCYAVQVGDLFDAIHHTDRRHEAGLTRKDFHEDDNIWWNTVASMARELRPIRDKLLGLMDGNHEDKLGKQARVNLIEMLCDLLNEPLIPEGDAENVLEWRRRLRNPVSDDHQGVKYLRYCAVIKLAFRYTPGKNGKQKRNINIWMHHGAGGGVTKGGSINKICRAAEIVQGAHIMIMGHKHDQITTPLPVLDVSGDIVRSMERHAAVVPSFLHAYGPGRPSYAEKNMFRPAPIGYTKFTIRPFIGRDHLRYTIEPTHVTL